MPFQFRRFSRRRSRCWPRRCFRELRWPRPLSVYQRSFLSGIPRLSDQIPVLSSTQKSGDSKRQNISVPGLGLSLPEPLREIVVAECRCSPAIHRYDCTSHQRRLVCGHIGSQSSDICGRTEMADRIKFGVLDTDPVRDRPSSPFVIVVCEQFSTDLTRSYCVDSISFGTNFDREIACETIDPTFATLYGNHSESVCTP